MRQFCEMTNAVQRDLQNICLWKKVVINPHYTFLQMTEDFRV